jgi:ribosome-binding factor A
MARNGATMALSGQPFAPRFLIFSCVLLRSGALEKRGVKHHRGRLGEALREEIETLVEGELADPRIGLVNVTGVHLAEDGRTAQVLVDVDGDDDEAEQSMQGLDAAKAYIRHELADRLRLRRAPELFFRLDRSEREQARVEQLLERAKKRNKARKDANGEKA